ncbi:MAG TPA: imelysin family protein [Geminicoccaceae bacterium]|nr:imelysin family protein [Geminicoccaceae bacterium]
MRSLGTLSITAAALAMSVAAGVDAAEPDQAAVLATYADIAEATYEDAWLTAKDLQSAIDAFLAEPGAPTHEAAKDAWLAARVPYQQTEAYRFGNAIVDDWEGRVNAWPLDEGLIDYVAASYGTESDVNLYYAANVIANPKLTSGGQEIDASTIDAEVVRSLHEIDDVEANVAIGYHAVEFLLWGQDLNGTGPGAGVRPWTDFATDACTGGNCERRRAYLKAVGDLLVSDLEEMVGQWREGGAARQAVTEGPAKGGLTSMMVGLGSLSYGELAGERMKLGLMLRDPEEEHDCFSDNTHNSHYYDARGIANVYLGRYQRVDGSTVEGASLSDLVRATDPALDDDMRARLDSTMAAMQALKDTADRGEMAYDQMLAEDNPEGNALVQAAIDALLEQTKAIERVVAALDLGPLAFEGSDSLDNPDAVFQ